MGVLAEVLAAGLTEVSQNCSQGCSQEYSLKGLPGVFAIMLLRVSIGVITRELTGTPAGIFIGVRRTNRSIPRSTARNLYGTSHKRTRKSIHMRTNK